MIVAKEIGSVAERVKEVVRKIPEPYRTATGISLFGLAAAGLVIAFPTVRFLSKSLLTAVAVYKVIDSYEQISRKATEAEKRKPGKVS